MSGLLETYSFLVGWDRVIEHRGICSRNKCHATRNKCIASSNKCLTSSNKKLLGTRSSFLCNKILHFGRRQQWACLLQRWYWPSQVHSALSALIRHMCMCWCKFFRTDKSGHYRFLWFIHLNMAMSHSPSFQDWHSLVTVPSAQPFFFDPRMCPACATWLNSFCFCRRMSHFLKIQTGTRRHIGTCWGRTLEKILRMWSTPNDSLQFGRVHSVRLTNLKRNWMDNELG